MAFSQPAYVVAEADQDLTVTVTVPTDTTSWTMSAIVRAYEGATALVTKTTSSGITNTPGGSSSTVVIAFAAADLNMAPGAYIWQLHRTNSGSVYPITDVSTFLVTSSDAEASPRLTNLSEYLAFAGLSETVTDTDAKALLQFLSAAETSVRDWCGRKFNYNTYTEYPVATWTDKLMLREVPIDPDDLDIRFDWERSWAASSELTEEVDYYLDTDSHDGLSHNGIIYRLNTIWEGYRRRPTAMLTTQKIPRRGPIKAVYSGGYTLIPFDLKLAVFQIVQQRLAARGLGVPLQSEAGMNYSYSRGSMDEEARAMASVQQILARYRRGDTYVG